MIFKDNDKAVSPVVATLVLIVVAIIGAAAVGTMLGLFSNSVSNSASADKVNTASSTAISVGGSTTVEAFSTLAAAAYEAAHQGVQINVQGGGSGAGVVGAGQGVLDVGSTSRPVYSTENLTYPNLQTFEIGACAACFIVNSKLALTTADQKDLATAYGPGTTTLSTTLGTGTGAPTVDVYGRESGSGTRAVVDSWLGSYGTTPGTSSLTEGAGVSAQSGNQLVESAVDGDQKGLGYVDYGFTVGDNSVTVLGLTTEDDVVGRQVLGHGGVAKASAITVAPGSINDALILKELQTGGTAPGTYYPEGLLQPMYYITNGKPTSMENDYIKFCQSPAGDDIMKKCHYIGLVEYK